jgi:WD repeat-containing protein 6
LCYSNGVVEVLPDDVLVLLWGATSFAAVSLNEFFAQASSKAIPEIVISDWILDARLLDSKTVLLVTAHNSLLVYSLEAGTLLRRYDCEEQSLLYAAQLYLTNDKDVLVATGTVFNEIQLWRPLANSLSKESDSITRVPIAKRLNGHEGCIFSLRFNEEGNLLASCSDDRTIRVWDVKQGTYLAIGFAHIARVWDVRFLPTLSNSEDEIYLLSSSEDTSAILWHFNMSEQTLKVQEQYHGHGGKHVWSQAISYDGNMAATGGNDGGVSIWDIGGWKDRLGSTTSNIYWKEPSQRVTINGKDKVDLIKGYRCLDHDNLLMTTGSGYVLNQLY